MSSPAETSVLAAIGLTPKIDGGDHAAIRFFEGPDFISYVRRSYPDSPEHDTDEIHRMYETIRIHLPTGLRFYCLSHESYDDQSVDYTLYRPHVITRSGKSLEVVELLLDKQLAVTSEGEIPMVNISRDPE